MKLLLDTCTFLWLNGQVEQLPNGVQEVLQSDENELFLSAASAWEIAVKYAGGRLTLPQNPAVWIPSRRELNGITSLPIAEESTLHLMKLQLLHKDPFDRILVCQAIAEGLTILTPDPLIRQYPVRVFW